jgi:hypothetical protein
MKDARPSGWWMIDELKPLGDYKRTEMSVTVTEPDRSQRTHTTFSFSWECGCRGHGLMDWVQLTNRCPVHAKI